MGIEIPQNKFLILDGAMGTVLQQRGLSPQGRPELLNLTEPELLNSVYKAVSYTHLTLPTTPYV